MKPTLMIATISLREQRNKNTDKCLPMEKKNPHHVRVIFQFDGHNDDPRPLFEIDEAKAWCEAMVTRHPSLLLMLDTPRSPVGQVGTDDTLSLILSCIADQTDSVTFTGVTDDPQTAPMLTKIGFSTEKWALLRMTIAQEALKWKYPTESLFDHLDAMLLSQKKTP